MRMRAAAGFAIAMAVLTDAPPASAQTRGGRLSISVTGAFQATTNPFTDRFQFEANRELGSTETQYPIERGPVIDASVAFRLWKKLSAGLTVSHFARDEVVHTNSRVPHPFLDDTMREIDSSPGGLKRTEQGVHPQMLYSLWWKDPLRVTIFGGPSYVRVEQDVVTSVQYDEIYPYDAATFRGIVTRRVSGTGTGFNAGTDVSWMFTRHIGIGAVARLTKVRVDADLPGGRLALDAGGLSGGGGLRFVF